MCVFLKFACVCVFQRGETALHMAARAGQSNVVRYLVQNGARVDAKAKVMCARACASSLYNASPILHHLTPFAWFFFSYGQDEQTPLHIASRLGKQDIVQQLLANGASPDTTTSSGYTPLHLAAREGHREVAATLLDQGSSLGITTKVRIASMQHSLLLMQFN